MKVYQVEYQVPERYQQLAMTTANKNITQQDRIGNMAMGLSGEAAELLSLGFESETDHYEAILKEMGDVCWYVALGCDTLAFDFNELLNVAIKNVEGREVKFSMVIEQFVGVVKHAGYVTDLVKKHFYQAHQLDVVGVKDNLIGILEKLVIVSVCGNIEFNQILDMNVKKLAARYPQGFQKERSENRVKGDI